jgi:hypothetical protein
MTGFTSSMDTKVPTGLVRTAAGMRQKMCVSPPPIVEVERVDDPYMYPITTKSQHPPIYIDGDLPRQSSIVFTTSKTQEASPDMRVVKRKSFLHVNSTDTKQASMENFYASEIGSTDLKTRKEAIFQSPNLKVQQGSISQRYPGVLTKAE